MPLPKGVVNIAVIKYIWNYPYEKKITITTEIVLIHLFFLTVVSKQKLKRKTRNTMAFSYYSKVTCTQNKGVPFFFVWFMECSVYLYV